MTTWLEALMVEYKVPLSFYEDIKTCLVSESEITVKCELLVELGIDNDDFVRKALDILQSKTPQSLVNPAEFNQNIALKKKHEDFRLDCEEDLFEESMEQFQSLSPADLLQALFTDLEFDLIDQILSSHNYIVQDAIDSIVEQKQIESFKKQPKQVCRHFILGQCYRSDCWFSHDPDAIICKFWLKGSCYKGNGCEFSHGQILAQVAAPPVSVTATSSPKFKNKSLPSSDDFPALGGNTMKKSIDFLSATNYDKALKKPISANQEKEEQVYTEQQQRRKHQKAQKLDVTWVPTGEVLASSYFKYRSEAIDVALNRNRLFQKYFFIINKRATEAYLSGHKATARELSIAAHKLNEKVSTLHQEAAEKIFSERNKKLNSYNNDQIIDLHGLHPEESCNILDNSIKKLQQSKYKGNVVIITGTGNHSRGNLKVLPVVRSYLEKKGFKTREATLNDRKGGMLTIKL